MPCYSGYGPSQEGAMYGSSTPTTNEKEKDMPCYEPPRPSESEESLQNQLSKITKDRQEYLGKLAETTLRVEWLEAALCAVFNELDKRNITAGVMAESSRNGLIGLMEFWSTHKAGDKARLAAELHKYSKDEQEILRQLLREGK